MTMYCMSIPVNSQHSFLVVSSFVMEVHGIITRFPLFSSVLQGDPYKVIRVIKFYVITQRKIQLLVIIFDVYVCVIFDF